MKEVLRNFSKKDELNSIGATSLQEIAGQIINISGIAIDERPDRDGVARDVGLIKTSDGTIYSTISDTVIRGLWSISDYMEDEGLDSVDIRVNQKEAKSGRNFLILQIV